MTNSRETPLESDESVKAAFITLYEKDESSGHVRSLPFYQAQFPSHEELIARLYRQVSSFLEPFDPNASTADANGPRTNGWGDDELFAERFCIKSEIGDGAQGSVFLAEDVVLGRSVAIKLLKGLAAYSVTVRERFHREARLAARLEHPNLCRIYESGEDGGCVYITMAHIEGETLASRLRDARAADRGDQPSALSLCDAESPRKKIECVLGFMEKVAFATHFAHEAGVLHRDLTPRNIMVRSGCEPVILDFGLAIELDAEATGLTETGEVMGTPLYMAPDALAKEPAFDQRTDVWALGVILFECLTLSRPFSAHTREALYRDILESEPPDVRSLNPRLTKDVSIVVQTALSKDPDKRYQTALDLAVDLRALIDRTEISARPVGVITKIGRWLIRNPALAVAEMVAVLVLLVSVLVLSSFNAELKMSNSELDTKRSELRSTIGDLKTANSQLSDTNDLLAKREEEAVSARADTQQALEEAREEKGRTQDALKDSEKQRNRADSVKTFLLEEVLGLVNPLSNHDMSDRVGRLSEVTLLDAIDRASERIEEMFSDDPAVEAEIRAMVGAAFLGTGDRDRGEVEYRKALSLLEVVYGNDHAATAHSRAELARVMLFSGALKESQKFFEAAMPVLDRELGVDHVRSLKARAAYALLVANLGEQDRATELFRAAYEQGVRVLGIESVQAMITANNFALHLMQNVHDFKGAVKYFRLAVKYAPMHYSPQHRTLTMMRLNIGVALHRRSSELKKSDRTKEYEAHLAEAIDALEKGVQARLKTFDHSEGQTRGAMNYLARMMLEAGRYAESLEWLQVSFNLYNEHAGPGQAGTLRVLRTIADCLDRMGRSVESDAKLQEGLRRCDQPEGAKAERPLFVNQRISLFATRAKAAIAEKDDGKLESLLNEALAFLKADSEAGHAVSDKRRATFITPLAKLYRRTGREAKALELERDSSKKVK